MVRDSSWVQSNPSHICSMRQAWSVSKRRNLYKMYTSLTYISSVCTRLVRVCGRKVRKTPVNMRETKEQLDRIPVIWRSPSYFTTIGSNGAIWLVNLPLSLRVQTTLFASKSHATPLSALKHGWPQNLILTSMLTVFVITVVKVLWTHKLAQPYSRMSTTN